jgi:integrase
MGSVFHRGKRWYVKFRGKKYSTGSTKEQDAVDKLLELRRKEAAGELPSAKGVYSVAQLIDDYLKRKKLQPGTKATYESQARIHLKPFFGEVPLNKITTDLLSDYREKREKQEIRQGSNGKTACKEKRRKVGQTSINRELALLRAAMKDLSARRPKVLAAVPYFPMESEKGNVRQGFLRDDDFERKLLPHLPRHLKAVTSCAFYAGARRGEWFSVKVSDLNLAGLTVYLWNTKEKDPREVPIFYPSVELLQAEKEYHDLVCPDEPYLFTYNGRRLKGYCRKAWKRACIEAGFPNLQFHDMRRSANMGMRDSGTPQGVRMKITGHKTDSMDRRYGIVDKENLDIAREKRGMGRAGNSSTSLRRVR